MTRNRPREESMWYCPDCEVWVGYKRDECANGHSEPWRPLRAADVDVTAAWQVSKWDVWKAKLGVFGL